LILPVGVWNMSMGVTLLIDTSDKLYLINIVMGAVMLVLGENNEN